MLVSMTGFATKTIIIQRQELSSQVTMSLKTLNGRFLEATCKLPPALQSLEIELLKLFKKNLHRGSILFTIQLSNQGFFKGAIIAEISIVQDYLKAIKHIEETCKPEGAVTINDLIALPSIFSFQEHAIDENEKNLILKAAEELIAQVAKARIAEGNALQLDLEQRYQIMIEEIEHITHLSDQIMHDRKQKLIERLKEIPLTPEAQETQRNLLYFELDKMDIHEEIVRFNNHLQTFINTLQNSDIEKGRRLDFTIQELNREINTIAAKCSDTEIGTHAINIKVELEKAREQIQNVI